MLAFHRLSTGPTLPDLIRDAADAQAAAWSRSMPLAAWCRAPTVLMLQAQGCPALRWQSAPPSPQRVRRAGRAVGMQVCFASAAIVLATARLLLRAGLLRSNEAATALSWSSRLAAAGMRLWRRGR
jgi:hypothetical protein